MDPDELTEEELDELETKPHPWQLEAHRPGAFENIPSRQNRSMRAYVKKVREEIGIEPDEEIANKIRELSASWPDPDYTPS